MNQLKNRKFLITTLSLAIICVFTLTIAYSALSAVLTINGNARVSAADWDIYLNNPRVTNGSATTNVPEIKTSSTLEFSTTLNMPGDFYEFEVDVVNGGDIDAMIENVVKNPELTAEQAKFLKYEVSYQNGENITTKQTLTKNTTMPIKVRIEYRKDLVASDLPTGQVVLDLSLTLEYIQSDGTGSTVTNNGAWPIANGDINEIGTIVTIGSEQFYTIGTEGNDVKLLSMYNLYIGGVYYNSKWSEYGSEATGLQNSEMKGWIASSKPKNGTIPFSSTAYWANNETYPSYVYNSSSNLYKYIENYKIFLENFEIVVNEARLIKYQEVIDLGCSVQSHDCEGFAPDWVYSTSYWSGSAYDNAHIWSVYASSEFFKSGDDDDYDTFGCRPVIVISKDYFN